ncbi:uncharacterized protein LOC130111863 [Lampris incognitus]|uniref:uncharacterized protein LOC130111863 n=1 Tax=Lampris incognitus TaxID=2546036 RepID=UPI0024B584F7|nr:uncharacterized protein LOC130111863 [Lampris incognitus]
MVEDFIPTNRIKDVKPLSSIPVHLSLTVEEGSSSCSAAPVPSGQTPREGTMLYILPYMQTDITVSFVSELESVSEIAVVGPPDLFRSGLITNGSITTMMTAWVRDLNKLAPLLPICFAANTNSLQSHSRCVWLFQLEMKTLPAGTELRCEKTEMTLLLPLATLENVNLAELKLNSPTCPVNYNNTHLTARIPLTGCGTKKVHSGSELIYTNTLKSVRPYTKVSRLPSLVLPLACRIPGLKATGPKYKIAMPQEKEFFGNFTLWLETHMPGEGPFSEFTRIPRFHKLHSFLPGHVHRKAMPALSVDSPRFFSGSTGSSSNKLDLHVMSSCHVRRAELFIGNCMESETEDFADPHPILENGCMASNSTLEVILVTSTARVYRIDLSGINAKGSKMFLECTVYLCISTMPSKKCPDPCAASHSSRMLTENIFSRTYTVQSEAIVLEVNNVTPKPTAVITTAATHQVMNANTATPAVTVTTTTTTATSNAPEEASAMSMAVILTVICISL